MASISATTSGPCFCCGGTPPPATCSCALLIPPLASPYVDHATAAAVIADALQVSNCIGYFVDGSGNATSFSAVQSATNIVLTGNFSPSSGTFGYSWLSVALLVSETVSFAFTGGTRISVDIYKCDGTLVETLTGTSTVTSSAIPADGEYLFRIYVSVTIGDPPFTTATATVTPSGAFSVNPVIALWTDGANTRKLWACPKLLLPIKTELTAIWYADCAAAAAALADSSVAASCLGYIESVALNSFAVTGGATPEFIGSGNNVTPFTFYPAITMYGSLNAIGGSSLTINYTITTDGNNPPPSLATNVVLYDSDWNVLDSFTDGAGGVNTFTGSHVFTIPYSGRFYLGMHVQGIPKLDGSDNPIVSYVTGDFLFSSDGALSANPVQARYDRGLTCAGLLDCGHTCP